MTPKELDEWLTDIDCGSWGEREDVPISAASEVFAVVTDLRAELLALRAANAQLREAAQYFADLESCDDPGHAECVGDSGPYCQTHGENNMHVTERDKLRAALASSPPHPETEGQP